VGLEPAKRRRNDFFGIAVELGDERRQEGKGVAAQRAKKTPDWNGICGCKSNQVAHIAPMPPQMSAMFADLAVGGFGKLLALKTPKVFINLIFMLIARTHPPIIVCRVVVSAESG
jgi:hypothetical protein